LVRGKSGYINGASTLAGRIDQDDGQHLTFAIMVKDVKSSADAKRLHEAILAEAVRTMPRFSQTDEQVAHETQLATNRGMINASSPVQQAGLPLSEAGSTIHLLLNTDQSPAQRNSTLFLSGTGVLLILLGIRLS
jgi:hypothetical protein